MKSKNKPYILYVAEKIYLEIYKIKNKNDNYSNIDAIDGFIGSEFYKKISYVKLSKKGIEVIGKKAITLAEYEGLIGHAQSIKSRIRRS